MKIVSRAILFVLAIAAFCSSIKAQTTHSVPPGTYEGFAFKTGNQLLDMCRNGDEDECIGYVMGAIDVIGTLQRSADEHGNLYWKYSFVCLPEKVTPRQIKDVVVKYLVEHPELRHLKAAQLIIMSMLETWGCPDK